MSLKEVVVAVGFGAVGSVRTDEGTEVEVDGLVVGFESFFLGEREEGKRGRGGSGD